MRLNSIILFFTILLFSCDDSSEFDVVIVGGGAGGTSAAIQSARNGAKTLLIEETEWLGGMLTSAGVSAIDGNYKLPSGCLLYTSPSPRDLSTSRMPSSA